MRVKGRFQQLGTQLFLFYMLISLIVLSVASFFIYTFMLNVFKDTNERLLLQQFQQLDHNMDGLIGDVDSLSKLFLTDVNVQRFLSYKPEHGEAELLELQQDFHSTIESYVGSYDFIDSIYIVGKSTGAFGGNVNSTLVHRSEPWLRGFLASTLFVGAHQSFPEMVVEGGIQKTTYNPYMGGADNGTVISMARGVRPLYESVTNAVLILNVDERYLSSIYSTSLAEGDGKMYIVDGRGTVISSSQSADIGTQSPFDPIDEQAGDYGSFDVEHANASVQVVYYKLEDMNWYIMKEIPLDYFSDQIQSAQLLLIIVISSSLIVMLVISYFWMKKMIRPLHILAHKMKDMSRGELGITFTKIPNNEFGMVIRRFNEMSLSIVGLIQKNNDMQEKRRKLEMEALQNQINPHFLYNTLNMIRWMAASIKAEAIVNSVVALGNILRPAFTSKEAMCTLRDELSYLENYIKIINWRYGNHVLFSIDVDEVYLDHKIPRFILQPLIENSITSGRQEEGEDIHIEIKVLEEEEDLVVTVMDSGVGIDPLRIEQLNARLQSTDENTELIGDGHGIGLYNVNKRIQLNYGTSPYGLRLIQRTKGAEVQVRLPRQSG